MIKAGSHFRQWAWVIPVLLAAFAAVRAAESTNATSLLTLERLYNGSEFDAESPPGLTWRQGKRGFYQWERAQAGGAGRDLLLVDPETDKREVVIPAHRFVPAGESGTLNVESFEWSADESKLLIYTNSKRLWRANTRGDYWLLDVTSWELRKLGARFPSSSLMFAKLSPDGRQVAYVHENNLWVEKVGEPGAMTQLTRDGSRTIVNGTFDWVYEEELDLRSGFRWSPDSRSIAYWQLDSSGVPEFFLVNNTAGLYPKLSTIPYPKAGEKNSAAKVGVVGSEGGATRWLSVPGDPRNNYLARMEWSPDGKELAIQQFTRLQNTNIVYLADPGSGEVKKAFVETDQAWIENDNPVRWLEKGKDFFWLSDRSGWLQAYRISRDGKNVSKITEGKFDIKQFEVVDEKNGWLYYTASPKNATQSYLYRVSLKGGGSERITPKNQPGTHSYNVSPDGAFAVHTYSRFDQPPVSDLVKLPEHKVVKSLTDNKKLKEKLGTLKRPTSEFLQVDIGEGVMLDASCIRPPDFDASRKYPVLFHVYGEPHGQTVRDVWGGRTMMWHWMLAQKGCIVMSVDNRGTLSPRGREFRKAVYKKVGSMTAADQAAAVRALLKKWSYLDPQRVGIWGWSGGGTSTLNALLQYPDLYQTGVSVAPVPNLRFYDSIYEERYMGLPDENQEGYRKGSAVTHAANLRGNLLIVHGTGDDNVHYQGTESLINELVANNKQFRMMSYPNRTHGISEGKNTTRHLFALLTSFLEEKLIQGGAETAK